MAADDKVVLGLTHAEDDAESVLICYLLGVEALRAGNYLLLVDQTGQQPKLLLQRVTEPKSGKNRMHFDIETPTVDEEVARLEALGAQRLEADAVEEHGSRWVVMADPEGNEFCVCNGGVSR